MAEENATAKVSLAPSIPAQGQKQETPVATSAEKPVVQPAGQPTAQPAQHPSAQPTGQPTQKPEEAPVNPMNHPDNFIVQPSAPKAPLYTDDLKKQVMQNNATPTAEQEKTQAGVANTAIIGAKNDTSLPGQQGRPATENGHIVYTAATATAFLKELFANGNECITAPTGSFPVKEDTRLLLALFSNGRFLVSETYKYDGRVLSFEVLAKRKRLQIMAPEYVPMAALTAVYDYVQRVKTTSVSIIDDTSGEHEQAKMQRDFVTIISRAAAMQVSDVHIVVGEHTTVMFRVNGLMQTEMEYNQEWGESFVRAAFASADISDSNYAQNEYQAAQKLGRTPLRGSGGKLVLPRSVLGIRLQFNPIAFGTRYVVMRLLYADKDSKEANDLQVLGFTEKQTQLFYRLRAVPVGMVVVSGPTGSGKSTTLQRNMIAMLQERNYEINLITVEDPPEYPIPGARQMPVTNASVEEAKDREFTKALSAALRSDPDALMIGEIRTLSAADLAFRGALSGHSVWTTLHANSAPAIILRLKDMGVEDFKLLDPELMKGLTAQRLFRKVCPYCRMPAKDHLDHPAVQRLRRAFGDIGLEYAYLRGAGCKFCDFRGVKGRTVISEFILPDSTFLEMMIKGELKKAINYWTIDLDGRTLRENAQERMLQGIIDIDEVERWTGFLDEPQIFA